MNPITTIGAIVSVGLLYVIMPIMLDTYRRFRGTRVVTCPETQQPASVNLNAKQAVLHAAIGADHFVVERCSRWPARHDCGQQCLAEIQQAPDEHRMRTVLTKWYEDKSCAICDLPFGKLGCLDNKPGLRSPSGKMLEWAEIPSETLSQVLATHQPICWSCLIAEVFRQANAGMFIDWPNKSAHAH